MSMLALAGCSDPGTTGTDTVEETDSAQVLDIDTFAEDPEAYFGEVVTVSARLREVVGEHAFVITNAEDATPEPLLILDTDPVDLRPDVAVTVTGVANRAFHSAAVEDSLGIVLDDRLSQDWEGEPYLVAETIDTGA